MTRRCWRWFGIAALAAVGCSDADSTGSTSQPHTGPLTSSIEPPVTSGQPDAAVSCAGQPAPPPVAEPRPCNGGKLARNATGFMCDCRGTNKGGLFCEDAGDGADAGTGIASGRTLWLSSPYHSSCVIMEDHTVRCWGRNDFGQLGDGGRTNRNVATEVPRLAHVQQLDQGLATVCAVLDDNSLSCWGSNTTGQLHNGSNNHRSSPTAVTGVEDVAQVSLGDSQVCARHTDDSLECWAEGGTRELAAATGTRDVVDVKAGFFMTTAWLRDGSLRNWGRSIPVVPAQARIKRVASGYFHQCALTDDGRVYCSGDGGNGESGAREGNDGHVKGITDAIDISAGFEHTCVLLRDSTLRCWGQNERGQLGDGTNDDSSLPVTVLGAQHVTQVQSGRDHTCARHEDGSISCWGSNEYGQLGNGGTNDSNKPVNVEGL